MAQAQTIPFPMSLLSTTLAGILIASPAAAQADEAEIVVTATKLSTPVRDIPAMLRRMP